MSAEKRSVYTDALQTLGTVIDESGKRDAIHLAVEPCIAGEQLYPGQHIGIVDGKATTKAAKKLGIVDPFISAFVPEGCRFWLIVYPRQITSLRHVWEHPDFPEQQVQDIERKNESEKWLREFARSNDCPSYEEMVSYVKDAGGDYNDRSFFVGENECYTTIPEEFWEHMEVVTGLTIKGRPTYFSCAC